MSSLPLTGEPAYDSFIGQGFIDKEQASSTPTAAFQPSPNFPVSPNNWQEKQARVLQHIASSGRLIDVRPASRLEVRPRPEMISIGIPELDALTGGLPRGCLSEICGPGSSGKTSVLLATMSAATRRDESCVLIDASDGFDPESGAAARVNFGKLLWVRCGRKSSDFSRQSSAKPLVLRRWSFAKQSSELNFKANNQRSRNNDCSSDDRRPTTDDFASYEVQPTTHYLTKTRSEHRLAQVLKTTDLILQSGGFGLVVLDLAGVPEKFVRRIPLASWFRFQRAVEHTKTALLVVSEFPCAQTCAALVLKTSIQYSAFSTQPIKKPSHSQLIEDMRIEAELARTRLERKPMQSVKANFTTRAVRAG